MQLLQSTEALWAYENDSYLFGRSKSEIAIVLTMVDKEMKNFDEAVFKRERIVEA